MGTVPWRGKGACDLILLGDSGGTGASPLSSIMSGECGSSGGGTSRRCVNDAWTRAATTTPVKTTATGSCRAAGATVRVLHSALT